jgi:hypothetical protein
MVAMGAFLQDLKEWQPFFSTVALASSTLVGLLFVSLSIYRGRGESFPPDRLPAAQGSFGDFLYVLMIGLVFLVPHQTPVGLTVALAVLGAARLIGLARQAVRFRRSPWMKGAGAEGLREYGLPGFASLGLVAVAVEIWLGRPIAIYALVLVIAALLTTGSWNAWLLLVRPESGGRTLQGGQDG